MSSTVTHGIRVIASSVYLPEQSDPAANRYVFGYAIRIENVGDQPAKLERRHWIITNAAGEIEEVEGPGVIGKTPRLTPGKAFEYTSGCVLSTPRGTMHGTYQMVRDDGTAFDAEIAPFVLTAPTASSERYLN